MKAHTLVIKQVILFKDFWNLISPEAKNINMVAIVDYFY